ncbi:MAG: single-stranded DNA-binding protein [Comamonadaceae bacterium]|nr:single-stranded DNA-binding protein [Comamonadaceae bacterium]
MDYINQVILAGIVADEPVRRVMGNGKPELVATLATENHWLDGRSGQAMSRTDWHTLVIYGRLGERAHAEMRPGVAVRVEGRLRTRSLNQPGHTQRPVTLVEVVQFVVLDAASEPAAAPADWPADAPAPSRARPFVAVGVQTPFTADFGPYRSEAAPEPETDSDSDPITDFW